MSKAIWSIRGNEVCRHRVVIAQIQNRADGKLGWVGVAFKLERCGFETSGPGLLAILEDVKYFYRYRRPRLVLTFKSGRKAVFP